MQNKSSRSLTTSRSFNIKKNIALSSRKDGELLASTAEGFTKRNLIRSRSISRSRLKPPTKIPDQYESEQLDVLAKSQRLLQSSQESEAEAEVLKNFTVYKKYILERGLRLRDKLDELPQEQQQQLLQSNQHFDIRLTALLIQMMKSRVIEPKFKNLMPATFKKMENHCIAFLRRQVAIRDSEAAKQALSRSVGEKYKEWLQAIHLRKYDPYPQ